MSNYIIGGQSESTYSCFNAGIFDVTALHGHCTYRNVLCDSKYAQNTREMLALARQLHSSSTLY